MVVGLSGYRPPTDAIIWPPATRMVKLSDYLAGKGITGFDGWSLIGATGVTPDGKTIIGAGINPSGLSEEIACDAVRAPT